MSGSRAFAPSRPPSGQWHPAPARAPGATNWSSSPGRPIETETRALMESRFGHDFGRVKVHTDARAAESARSLGASAYTVGSDVVFGAGRYSPGTPKGRRLLAHELAHVVQQRHAGAGTPETLNDPSDTAEKGADEAARVYGAADSDTESSTRLRDRLRTSSLSRPAIQRAVATWGGEYETDKYDLTKDAGMNGVDIELRFKPNKYVDAKKIGMVQTGKSSEKGKAFAIGSGKDKKTLEGRMVPTGETGEGTMIDRLPAYGNPLYATEKPSAGDKLADTPTKAFWGQHGWRYVDNAGKEKKQDALLKDTPQLLSTRKESGQVFETTALAVAGSQEGTFYGSVQWGWEKDAAGKVKKLPLTLVANDVPSSVFARASEMWNKAKTSEGKETIDLPIVTGKYTNADAVQLVGDPAKAKTSVVGTLDKNTRLEVTSKGATEAFNKGAATRWWKVTVVDGTHIGKVGWVMETMLSDSKTK